MGLRSWAKKKIVLHYLDKTIESLKKEGGAMNPAIKEYVEGAVAFVLPMVLVGLADSLGAGNVIEWKTLLILSLTSLATYIRTRPTKQQ